MNQSITNINIFSAAKSPLIGCASASQKEYPNRWVRGQSGNLKGRPKLNVDAQHLARLYTPEAIHKLIEIACNPKVTPNTQMRAAAAVLNIAWTKQRKFQKFPFPFSGSVKMSLQNYIDLWQAARWGFSPDMTELYCAMQKKQRENQNQSCSMTNTR